MKRSEPRVRALIAALVLGALVLLALFGPAASPYSDRTLDWRHLAVPPGFVAQHWLGTDALGRDLYVRTLSGLRLSLLIGLLSTLVSVLIGVAWGAAAGWAGGRIDAGMMRVVDVLYALPYLFIVLILAALFGRGSIAVLLLAIGAVGWLTLARVVRAQTLSLKRQAFMEAARAGGLSGLQMLRRHVLPNLAGTVVVYATLMVPQMIVYESFLSFLGLGVEPPRASLGSLINAGARQMLSAPWLLLVPAVVLIVLLLSFNVLGDALRDVLDPQQR